jgi:VWFA-related protein
MRSDFRKAIFSVAPIVALVFVCSQSLRSQERCLTNDDVKKILEQVNSHQTAPLNKNLRADLLKLKENDEKRTREAVAENKKDDALLKGLRASRENNTALLCPILKEFGWPTSDLVGKDGVDAAFFLLKNSSSQQLQIDLLPVVVAAAKRGEIPRPTLAGYIDRLRLNAGLKQLFGTQATIINGFLVLYPIEGESQVAARRKVYELPPLAEYLRSLEQRYRLPLVRATGTLTNSFSENLKSSIAKTTASNLFEGQAVAEDEVIRVNTNLVNLNVSVYSNKLRTQVDKLDKKDFTVGEDGRPEEITFFATTDVPFDLVLLIDLSGSTSGKRDLIRKSTQRFIQAARPSDRLAIVTFWDTTEVVSPLTEDRAKLLESANKINGGGGSHVWDALKFTLDQVIGPKTLSRRRAVVFMTDGVDNALGYYGNGSEIAFADLLEAVRHSDTLIIPIYLDTEEGRGFSGFQSRMYENARKTLALLADESGGLYYKARKIEDLNGVYDQVIEDLGKVYSLGYKPTNDKRDGSWRTIKVAVPTRPDLLTRAKPGYYASNEPSH